MSRRRVAAMLLFSLVWALFASSALAAFGYVDGGTYWTIDTGNSLVVRVSKTNGDIQSMKYKVSLNAGASTSGATRADPLQNRVSSTMAIATRTLM